MTLLPPPTRNEWRRALSWALVHLSRGIDGHHVRPSETWDTAILRVTAGRLAMDGHRLPVAARPATNSSDAVRAVLGKAFFDDLQAAAASDPPSEDGKVQARGRRVRPKRRRGWKAA